MIGPRENERSSPRGPRSRVATSERFVELLWRGLVRLFGWLSFERGAALGAGFGKLWFRLRLPRVARVREQLASAYPEVPLGTREAWARGVFMHFGRGLVELCQLAGRHRARLLESVEIEGLEHLEAAENSTPHGGVLVATAHYGNWELAGIKVAEEGIALGAIYRGFANRGLDRALLDLRTGGASSGSARTPSEAEDAYLQIPLGRAGLALVRALESGRKVFVLLDQNARSGEGVFVPFFGEQASTRSGPLRLAVQRGVPVLPAFIRRRPDGLGHRIEIHPAEPLETGAAEDEEIDRRNTARITARIEAAIRVDPTQWIWTHRRWRTRPPSDRR